MDCDPDEYWCECDDEHFYDDSLDDCPNFRYYDPYDPDDYADRRYDELRDEGLI